MGPNGASQGADLAFFSLGGEGRPVLLLHGFGSDHLLWLANQQAVAGVASVFALDLPGHGESSMDVGAGAIVELAGRLEVRLDQQRLRALTLVGHSLGGAVALALAEKRPDLVAGLLLIAPAGLGGDPDRSFLEEFPRLTTAEAATALLQRLVVRPRLINKYMVERVLAHLARPGAREALERIAQGIIGGEAAIAQAMASVCARALPRLVVWGREDRISPVPEEELEVLSGEVLLVSGAGHLPHVEQPRLVNERIIEFLARPQS